MNTIRRNGANRSTLGATLAVVLLAAACSSDGNDEGGSAASSTDNAPASDAPHSTEATPSTDPEPSDTDPDDEEPASPGLTKAEVEASLPKLDNIVETAMAETGVPGIAVAVVFDDEVVYAQGYGVREVGRHDLVDPETIFQIASLSKPISSTIMAGAVGQDIFDWNDPVSGYNPDFVLSDAYVTENVTFADLFSHRSGIPAGGGDVLEAIGYDRTEVLRRLQYLELNPFRTTSGYSNFAMTAGGESAAVASGVSWEDMADEILFGPAGMTSTSMHYSDYESADNRAELHVNTENGWGAAFDRMPDAQAPAGGVSSNVIDLAQWLRLQLAGGQLDGEQIITEEALDLTHTTMILRGPPTPTIADSPNSYGLGWNIEVDATGATRWNHSGAFSTGASTTAKLLPAEGLGIVVLTNGEPVGAPEAITDAYFDQIQTRSWPEDVFAIWSDRFSGLYGAANEFEDLGDYAVPALDNAAYPGNYTNDYVGDIEVIDIDGDLAVVAGPAAVTYVLTHYDANTVTYIHDPELPDFLESAVFEIGPDGTATELTMSGFDVDGLGTFQRI
jgi:CubicO group peptidase (beta-lactamase class C family)